MVVCMPACLCVRMPARVRVCLGFMYGVHSIQANIHHYNIVHACQQLVYMSPPVASMWPYK